MMGLRNGLKQLQMMGLIDQLKRRSEKRVLREVYGHTYHISRTCQEIQKMICMQMQCLASFRLMFFGKICNRLLLSRRMMMKGGTYRPFFLQELS